MLVPHLQDVRLAPLEVLTELLNVVYAPGGGVAGGEPGAHDALVGEAEVVDVGGQDDLLLADLVVAVHVLGDEGGAELVEVEGGRVEEGLLQLQDQLGVVAVVEGKVARPGI